MSDVVDPLPPLREVIAGHGLGARKALGQHFLLDMNITAKIVRLAGIAPGDHVIEVGPGPGGLTRALLSAGAEVFAIERDSRCLAILEEIATVYPQRLHIREGDALETDFQALVNQSPTTRIISNLPYNISTELLIGWLMLPRGSWAGMALMFQKEVADRILAGPGSKTYGRLSVIAQTASRPSLGFSLPARAFTPPPKVASSVVLFAPPETDPPPLQTLARLTQAGFSQRRKMLRSSMKPLFGAQTQMRLMAAGIDPATRAEDIPVSAWQDLARMTV